MGGGHDVGLRGGAGCVDVVVWGSECASIWGQRLWLAFVGGVDADQTLGRDLVVLGCLGC